MEIIGEEIDEVKEKPKRNPKDFEHGFTKLENIILVQGIYLTSDAKVTYWALKSFHNAKTGLCYPSYDKILERSGLTRPRLADGIAELEQFHWLTKKKRFNGSTHYTFTTPQVWELNEFREQVGLFHDQTCPSKQQQKDWDAYLRMKKNRNRKGWNETVKAESKRVENREAQWKDLIPF